MSIVNAAKFLMGKVPNTTRVFRGVEPSLNVNKSLSGKMYPKSMSGRFFTESLPDASWYARRGNTLTGKVQYVDLPKKDFNIGRKMSERTPNPRFGEEVILPKKYINKSYLVGEPLGFFGHSQRGENEDDIIKLIKFNIEKEKQCYAGVDRDLIIVNSDVNSFKGNKFISELSTTEIPGGKIICITRKNIGQ